MNRSSPEHQSDLNIIFMSDGDIARMTSSQRMRFLESNIIIRSRSKGMDLRGTRYSYTEKGKMYLEEAIPVDKT